MIAKSASNTKPGVNVPVACLTIPNTNGGKNPPSPPAAPTSPVTAPTDCGKYSGTSLNTAPLPNPIPAAIPKPPLLNVPIIRPATHTPHPRRPAGQPRHRPVLLAEVFRDEFEHGSVGQPEPRGHPQSADRERGQQRASKENRQPRRRRKDPK